MRIFILFIVFGGILTIAWAEEPFVYQDHGKRDPFWRLVTPSGAIMNYETDILISDITLEGIITGPDGGNLAILNNIIVKPNDRIGPFFVERIEQDQVLLTDGQERFTLKLEKEQYHDKR